METTWFRSFINISSDAEKVAFKKEIEGTGFSALNQFINSLYDKVKNMDEKEFKEVKNWLELSKELLPDLSLYSPAWQDTWKELFYLYDTKVEIYSAVSNEERKGEWQVLFDNPFSTEQIVCHTNKTFTDAAYLTAKYQFKLRRAEYIKLQKVISVITKKGS